MVRTLFQLSAAKVRTAGVGFHADGGNLYLQVAKARGGGLTRSWVFRYRVGGRQHWMGLGSLNTISIADARAAALEARKLLVSGIDPLQTKRDRRASMALTKATTVTFDEAVRSYIAAHESGWRNERHREQWIETLGTYASPILGKLPVKDIDTGLVLQVLRPIWTATPETARRLRARIEAVINFAVHDGDRANPARWKGHLEFKLDKRARKARGVKPMAAMPYAEIGAFMDALRDREGVAAAALAFLILTAARTNEVLGADWAEIDLQAQTWTIPGDRMKSGKPHRVSLSTAAVAVLERAPDREGLIFSELQNRTAMLRLLRECGRDVTVHGFRSTFRTWAAECTSFPNAVIEMSLAHAVGSEVERSYQRSDLLEKRRQLMEAWADYCVRATP